MFREFVEFVVLTELGAEKKITAWEKDKMYGLRGEKLARKGLPKTIKCQISA